MDHLLRQLLLLQAAVVATSVVESAVIGAASPNLVSLALLNLAALAWTLRLRWSVGARPVQWTRALRWTQRGWITLASVDLALAIGIADRGLEPMALLTRIVLPVLILRTARRMDAARPPVGATSTEVAA